MILEYVDETECTCPGCGGEIILTFDTDGRTTWLHEIWRACSCHGFIITLDNEPYPPVEILICSPGEDCSASGLREQWYDEYLRLRDEMAKCCLIDGHRGCRQLADLKESRRAMRDLDDHVRRLLTLDGR